MIETSSYKKLSEVQDINNKYVIYFATGLFEEACIVFVRSVGTKARFVE